MLSDQGTRKPAGFVIVYRNDPHYKGIDTFLLVQGAGQAITNCCLLASATKFAEYASAREWLKLHPDAGKGTLPGEIVEVEEETHIVLKRPNAPKEVKDFLDRLENKKLP